MELKYNQYLDILPIKKALDEPIIKIIGVKEVILLDQLIYWETKYINDNQYLIVDLNKIEKLSFPFWNKNTIINLFEKLFLLNLITLKNNDNKEIKMIKVNKITLDNIKKIKNI